MLETKHAKTCSGFALQDFYVPPNKMEPYRELHVYVVGDATWVLLTIFGPLSHWGLVGNKWMIWYIGIIQDSLPLLLPPNNQQVIQFCESEPAG